MSVLIKGREMPKDCFSCYLKEEGFCNLTNELAVDIYKRNNDCPLVEFPKGEWLRMSDLSEKDDNRYKCSRCGNVIHHKSRMDLYTFNSWCGRCGSDNSRHITIIEAEDEG